MASAPGTHYAYNREVSIAYQVLGEGQPGLVFSLGRAASQLDILWDDPATARFLGRLASFSRLVLYDRRGIGLSDRGVTTFSFEEQIGDLRAVLDAAGVEEPIAHFSCHLGGRLSLVFAASYPARTSALVLFGSHPATLSDDDYPWGTTLDDNERLAEQFAASWGDEAFQASYLRQLAPSVADDPRVRRWWARMCRASISPAEGARRVRGLREIDVRYVLRTIRVPTLLLHRTGDQIANVGASRYMVERIPGAKLVELPGQDHLPMFGDSDALVEEVQAFVTGIRPAPAPDRILATVLFTDIVGSTRHASQLGDRRWRDVLDRHNVAVREQLGRFAGREIKTTGDGFLALFESPNRAIRCAQALVTEAPALGIELRAGIHTGECERMGDDVSGIAVHIAARVSASAGPGEVLLSRTVQDLVAGSDIAFADRGEHELKGVPGTWRLFAVRD